HGENRNSDAERVGHGIADRRPGRDDRRFAEADDAAAVFAFRFVELDDDVADVAPPGQLVVGDFAVHERAGLLVHDSVVEERIGDAHDDRPVDLRRRELAIHYHADVLNGDELLHLDNARLAIDGDFGHLYARDLGVRKQAAGAELRVLRAADELAL